MRYVLRFLLLVCFWSPVASFAFAPSAQYYTSNGYTVSSSNASGLRVRVCSAIEAALTAGNPTRRYSVKSAAYPDGCYINEYNASDNSLMGVKTYNISKTADVCPANSTTTAGNCQCNSGYVEQGGQCVNPNEVCSAKGGTSSIVGVTAGWQRTPSVASSQDWLYPTRLSSSGTGSVCNGGCTQNYDANEPCSDCKSYVSQVPNAQGLYRVSVDFMGHYSGSACSDSPSDQVIKPDDTKDPQCPGYVGEVNGVKGCYGTAEKPVRPEAPDPNIDRKPKEPGNPSAGTKPTSGEGSGSGGTGRTPSTGAGGSQGGPAAAASSGSKPDGTTNKPTDPTKEQQACGAPGQPKCAIDESGTPNSFSPDDGLASWKQKADANREQMAGAGGNTFSGFNAFFLCAADGGLHALCASRR